MRLRQSRSTNLASLSHWGNSKQDKQEMPKHPDGHGHDGKKEKECTSGGNKEKEVDEVATVMLGSHALATECPSLNIKIEMQEMFFRLGFIQVVAQKVIGDQEIDFQ